MNQAFALVSPDNRVRARVLPRKLDQGIREVSARYSLEPEEQKVLDLAMAIIERRLKPGTKIGSPNEMRDYLILKLHAQASETFNVIWLDNRHRILSFEQLFNGTIDGASVYPREIVRSALQWNAAAAVVAHNHPSGVPEPSAADRHITGEIKNALSLIGVRLLDHFVVGGNQATSFASRGWL